MAEFSQNNEKSFFGRIRGRPVGERRILFFAAFFSVGAVVLVLWLGQMRQQFGIAFGGSVPGEEESAARTRGQGGETAGPSSGSSELPGPLATLRENISFLRSEVTALVSGLEDVSRIQQGGSTDTITPEADADAVLPAVESAVSPDVRPASGASVKSQESSEKKSGTAGGFEEPVSNGTNEAGAAASSVKTVVPPHFTEASSTEEVVRPQPRVRILARDIEDGSGSARLLSVIHTNIVLLQEWARDGFSAVRTGFGSFAPGKAEVSETAPLGKFSLPQISFGYAGEVFKANAALITEGFRDFIQYLTH